MKNITFLGMADELILASFRNKFEIDKMFNSNILEIIKGYLIKYPGKAHIFRQMVISDCPKLLKQFDKIAILI